MRGPKLVRMEANNRETTTSAEACKDCKLQRPWTCKSEAQQSPPELHEISRRVMAVVVSSAFSQAGMNGGIFSIKTPKVF